MYIGKLSKVQANVPRNIQESMCNDFFNVYWKIGKY